MCVAFSKLELLVDDCVRHGAMFTVYELTEAVRGQGEFLKHSDSRSIVHGMFDANLLGNYRRTLVNLGGTDGPCFVYHPAHADPYRYQNKMGQTAQPVPASYGMGGNGQHQRVSPAIIRQISRDPHQRPLTSRRRICVPAAQVRNAGLSAGDTVYICFDSVSGTFTYETVCPADGVYDRVQKSTVDPHGSIRHPIADPQAVSYWVELTPLGSLQAAPRP
jgi:hypothetical protein